MLTYYIVMGMLACSVIAVVAAYAAERDNDDAPLPTPPEPPEAAVRRREGLVWAAMSASDGTGDGTPDPERDNWISQLAATLPPDVTVYNFAVSGSTLGEARLDQLPAILSSAPDVVSIWLAINDIIQDVPLADYEAALTDTLRTLRDAGCRVVVGNVLDVCLLPVVAADPDITAGAREVVPRWNAAIARVAAVEGAALVDLYAASAELATHPEYVGADGFHPSPAGHTRIAEEFRPAIGAALEAARRAKRA